MHVLNDCVFLSVLFSQRGETALFKAAEYGHQKAVELLLDRGADIEARSEVRSLGS
jgi:ankyrin repeat protein